jgi:hypothetical protein
VETLFIVDKLQNQEFRIWNSKQRFAIRFSHAELSQEFVAGWTTGSTNCEHKKKE